MDAWLIDFARRKGRAYFIAAGVAGLAFAYLLIAPSITAVPCRYLRLSVGEFVQMLAISWAGLTVLAVLAIWFTRRECLVLYRWLVFRDDEDVFEAREAVFRLPWKVIGVMLVVAIPFFVPVIVIALTELSGFQTTADYVALSIGALLAIGAAGAAGAYLIDVLCRPQRVLLGTREAQPIRHGGLGSRLVVAIIGATIYGGLTVGYLATSRAEAGSEYLFTVYGVAFVSGVLTAGLFAPLQLSIIGPIRDLRRGMRGVSRNRLDQQVPVTTADELGELVVNFNEMLGELRATRVRIVAAGDDARRRVERDLHDGAQQRLVLLGLKLNVAQRALADLPEHAAAIADARQELDLALAQLRDLARGIYPVSLGESGLVSAIGEAIKRAGLPVTFTHDGADRFDSDIEAAVYFCCVEALQNAAKHAGEGAAATVTLEHTDSELRFTVADDGSGFRVAADSGAGLRNMEDRLAALGGAVVVESAPGAGTIVRGGVPL